MRRLFVHHHLGLGDHFDCNGLVRYIRAQACPSDYDTFHVFAIKSHYPIIKYMYRDDPLIIVEEVKDYASEYKDIPKIVAAYYLPPYPPTRSNVVVIGHEYYLGAGNKDVEEGKNCWEYFYEQVNLPPNVRHEAFGLKRDMGEENRVFYKLNPSDEPYIFLHDSPERGYVIDRSHFNNKNLKVIENDLDENPLHLLRIIEEATEIHCIESSLKTLIEFYENTDLLFYHDIRNHTLGKHAKKKWKTIKYDND